MVRARSGSMGNEPTRDDGSAVTMTERRPRQYADGLLDAMIVVAEVSGPMKMADFNDATWTMLCSINERLAKKAADAFGETAPREMVECTNCGASVRFGSCCDECDTPTDH